MRVSAAHAVRSYEGNWLRNRLLNDRGRYLASVLILDLHFNEAQTGGITGARLRREVSAYDVCSPGRATAFLAALRYGGYMETRPAENRKERRLAPTALLMQTHADRWMGIFRAIARMDPELAARAMSLPKAALFGPGTHYLAEMIRQGVRVLDFTPLLRDYAERDAGMALLLALFCLPDHEAPISASHAARHFAISRAHATALLRRAQADGLAVSAEGGYRAGPELEAAISRFYAVVFLIFMRAHEACEQVLEAGGCG